MKIKIKETFQIVTEESARLGDFAESGWNDEKGIDFDSIQEAVDYVKNEGGFYASCSCFAPHMWYDSAPIQDIFDGSYETRSFHPVGSVQACESFYKLFQGGRV